jgi:hypothetical protein
VVFRSASNQQGDRSGTADVSRLELADAVKQPGAVAEHHWSDVQPQLVDRSRRQVLVHRIGASGDRDIRLARSLPRLLQRRLDPVGDERNVVPPSIASGARGSG